MFTYRPFAASCESDLTYIDGDERAAHRVIGQLASIRAMEVSLLLNGELPTMGRARQVQPIATPRTSSWRLSRFPPRRTDSGDVRRGLDLSITTRPTSPIRSSADRRLMKMPTIA